MVKVKRNYKVGKCLNIDKWLRTLIRRTCYIKSTFNFANGE